MAKFIKNFNFIIIAFKDLFLIYKNFFNFNVYKILIFIYSILLGLLSTLPIILIFYIYTFYSNLDMSMLIEGLFNGVLFNDFIGNVLLFLILFSYFIGYFYYNILILKVQNIYLEGKKIKFKKYLFSFKELKKFVKNNVLNLEKFKEYFKLSFIIISILLLPFIIFGLLVIFLSYIFGGTKEITILFQNSDINYYSIILLIITILCIFLLIYLIYKIIFSIFIFSDEKVYNKDKKVFYYIKKSFKKTKGFKKFIKFIVLIIIFFTLSIPVYYFGKILDNNLRLLSDYTILNSLKPEQQEKISGKNAIYFEQLKLEFAGIDEQTIKKEISKNKFFAVLFIIFKFLLFYGIFTIVINSFYRKEIK